MSDKRYGGLIEAIRRWFDSPDDDSRRAVNEEITRKLPEPVNATRAIEEDRRRKKKLIDDVLAQRD